MDLTAADASSSIVSCKNLRFRWHKTEPFVIDIDKIEVETGQRVFLRGPSGSGKTTLLNLLAGVAVPTSGSIRILGAQLENSSGPQRDVFRADHIGFVFQMFNLIPYLSLIDNVILPLRFSKLRRGRVQENASGPAEEARRLLNLLGINPDSFENRSVMRLSVGQQQRVAAARALIGRPELVICDEPTSALDTDARQAFLDLLFREVDQAGASLVFVSHDQSLGQNFDRTILLTEINDAPLSGEGGP